jgi:hypothetical protein
VIIMSLRVNFKGAGFFFHMVPEHNVGAVVYWVASSAVRCEVTVL